MAELIYNDDGGNLYCYHPGDKWRDELIEKRVDMVARAGATVLVQSLASMRTTYPSDVWESYLDGYDRNGPDDQEFFEGLDPASVPIVRAELAAWLSVFDKGIDPAARALARAREQGMSPCVAIRMNDHHGTVPQTNCVVSSFWREHPEFRRHADKKGSRELQTLDYAHPEVRDHYRKLFVEVLDRYDFDGLTFDFMRGPACFKIGREAEGASIMTAWLGEICELIRKAADRRGHPIKVGARVPSEPMTALRFGLDVCAWAREGLVDMVTTCSGMYGGESDYEAPVRLWRDLLDPYGVKLAGTILPAEFRYPGAPGDGVNGGMTAGTDGTIGAAMALIYGGADGVELFNFFPEKILQNGRGWTEESFVSTLRALRSIETMLPLRRKHLVGGRQVTAPGEQIVHNPLVRATRNWCWELGEGKWPLPAEGEQLAFRLQTGPKPAGRAVHVVIGMEAGAPDGQGPLEGPPVVLVNDVSCPGRPAETDDVLFTYDVPEEAFSECEHVIEVIAPGEPETSLVRISRVEFIVEAES